MPIVGDGVTDDRAALQAMIDACPAGGFVDLVSTDTYRVVINYAVPNRGLVIKPGVTLRGNGARINLECDNNVYGIRFQNGSRLVNTRVALVSSTTLDSLQGIYQSVLSLGEAYSEILDQNNRGPFLEATGWGIHDVELSTVKTNGMHISGVGGVRGGHISDVVGLSNSNALGLINFDWGTVGQSGSVPVNRVNFNNSNGSFYTVHPSNIKIERIRAGVFSNPLSEIIRLSACSAIDINNVYVEGCGKSAFSHYGGDFGFEFCKYGAFRYQAFMNTAVRGLNVLSCGGNAIRLDCWADNIAREPGYVPLTPAIYPTNLLIDGVAAGGTGTAMAIGAMAGGTITRVRGNGFHVGANFASGLTRLVWSDSVMHGGDSSAIPYTGSTSGVTISRVIFES